MKTNNSDLIEEDETASWTATFADLMTILLCFFVLLYSMSTLDLARFKKVVESIRKSLGVSIVKVKDDKKTVEEKIAPKKIETPNIQQTNLEIQELLKDLKSFLENSKMQDFIELTYKNNKITISIKGIVFYQSGSNVLSSKALEILDEIIIIFVAHPEYQINIKGHTDDIPIKTDKFPSNWELSSLRATSVLRYLIKSKIEPSRLTATGFSDSMPIAPNDSEENRSKNRRVEFVLEKE